MRSINQRMASGAMLCGFTLIGLGAEAWAGADQEIIVQPNRDRIALCQEAMLEVARQGGVTLDEYAVWMAWRETMKDELARGVARLGEQHDFDKALAGAYAAAAPSLVPLEGETAHIPHFGWGVFGIVEQHRDDVNAAIAEVDKQVAQGSYGFHVAAQGWLTGEQLDAAIQADASRISELEAKLSDGSYAVNYPGLGWVNRTQLETCVANEQQKIVDTFAQISAGEYSVHLPTIGWITRNALNERIDKADEELAALQALKADGEMAINRTAAGWFTHTQLNSQIAVETARLSDFTATISGGEFTHNFPAGGWLTADQIQAAIEAARAGIAEVEAKAAAGEYAVPSGVGWANTHQANAALALPDCRDHGPTPCLTPAHRPHFQDVLRRIPIEVQADIAVRQLTVDKLQSWLGAIPSHATPQLDKFQATLDIYGVRQAEFDIELSNSEARLQRNLDWLRANLELLP